MTPQEYQTLKEEQERIICDAEDRIKLLNRKFVDEAPIKVGDLVKDAKTGEDCKVVSLGILHNFNPVRIGVEKVLRKKKDGTFSIQASNAYNGVVKDGITYRFTMNVVRSGHIMRDGNVVLETEE